MSVASELHAALQSAGLNIDSVVIGEDDPKDTWKIIWREEPSEADIAQAEAVADAFDAEAARERADAAKSLRASDAKTARIVDDIVAALTAKGVLTASDLPEAAQEVLAAREALREKVKR